MKRLIVVYNPRSSKANRVRREVFGPARKLAGFLVGKYEVSPTDVDDNAEKLAKILEDGDLVVAAGGDGTTSIGVNGCLLSGKKVVFGVVPFGNFNDTAVTFGKLKFEEIVEMFLRGKERRVYPLEILVDGRHFRYAISYMTIGMMAEATKVFDDRRVRKNLKKGRRKVFSYFELAKWYFLNRKQEFLPDGKTDYMAINGRRIGGIMKGGEMFLTKKFLSGAFNLRGVWGLTKFMTKSIILRIPGEETKKDILEFQGRARVKIHVEGESKMFECERIEVKKEESLRVILR